MTSDDDVDEYMQRSSRIRTRAIGAFTGLWTYALSIEAYRDMTKTKPLHETMNPTIRNITMPSLNLRADSSYHMQLREFDKTMQPYHQAIKALHDGSVTTAEIGKLERTVDSLASSKTVPSGVRDGLQEASRNLDVFAYRPAPERAHFYQDAHATVQQQKTAYKDSLHKEIRADNHIETPLLIGSMLLPGVLAAGIGAMVGPRVADVYQSVKGSVQNWMHGEEV